MATLEQTLELMKNRKICYQDISEDNKDNAVCPICNGMEFILKRNEYGIDSAVPCKCREEAIMKRKRNFADIPETFKNHTLENFDTQMYKLEDSKIQMDGIMKVIKYYLEDFKKQQENGMGLYFFSGTKGSGKTRMAASIANELLKDHQVKFATSPTILAEIKKTYDRESGNNVQTEYQLLDYLITSEILIIDDFGTEKITGWVNEKFYQIINERYIAKKVTIFTSNEEPGKTGYDTRITNRIIERTYPVKFPEESVRIALAHKQQNEFMDKAFKG